MQSSLKALVEMVAEMVYTLEVLVTLTFDQHLNDFFISKKRILKILTSKIKGLDIQRECHCNFAKLKLNIFLYSDLVIKLDFKKTSTTGPAIHILKLKY